MYVRIHHTHIYIYIYIYIYINKIMQCHSGIFKCPRTFEGHCMQNKSHKGYVQNDVFPSTCNTFPVATELNILGWWTMEWLYTLQWVFSQSHCCSNCSVFTQMVRQESAELTRILLDFQTCAHTHTHTHTHTDPPCHTMLHRKGATCGSILFITHGSVYRKP